MSAPKTATPANNNLTKLSSSAALLSFLRTWLPSLLIHAGILIALTFISIGSGLIGTDGDSETHVSIVMRNESNSQVDYHKQHEFELLEVAAEHIPVADAEQNSESNQQESQQQQEDVSNIIGIGSTGSGAGATSTGGGGGGASFFGIETKGKNFVFIVDRSGSMEGKYLQAAKSELQRSINALPRGTRYHVIFFSGNGLAFIEAPARKLVRASRQRNKEVFAWMDRIYAAGGTQPFGALSKALSLKPDVIYFLTDGQFPREDVLSISKSNKAHRIKINTIGFDIGGRQLLRELAKLNNGRYKFVSVPDQ